MQTLKHIGKLKNTGAKVAVVFRTLPGESNMALVLPTATLPDMYHDALFSVLESTQGQDSNELGEILFTRYFPDGRPMLGSLQQDNRLHKIPTDMVIMTPAINTDIPLDQLNLLIAEQRGVPVDELASLISGGKKTNDSPKQNATESTLPEVTENSVTLQAPADAVLSDKDLAKSYRSQADAMYKEAARLRREADELDPPQKKTAKIKEVEV